ncbi:MAG: LacI family DNA-binding transcriptional regulator [Rhizobacter sp.]|nr:LacI family DNA-binding transcriptional regulator [Rhizobacter sp.]
MDHTPRASLHDVAKAAGVSLATVDRVLHGRAGVRERTIERVNAVVQQLGYRPDPAAARLARNRRVRIAFVLPEGTNSFVGLLHQQVQALTPWLAEQHAVAAVQAVEAFSPPAIARHLAALQGQVDAVVLMALDHPQVRAAIDDLVAHGTAVVTLVSDVPSSKRDHFVGIDNVAAGRTAATLLGRFVGSRPGRVGIVLGSPSLRDHAERLFGFQQVMAAEHPHLQLLPPIEGHDSSERTEPLVARLLKREPELAGLYSIGAGNRGIESALTRSGRAGHVVWVCHELTAHARRALLEGVADAVINQDPGHEVRSACRLALARLSGERVLHDQERIHIDIFLKDNLP